MFFKDKYHICIYAIFLYSTLLGTSLIVRSLKLKWVPDEKILGLNIFENMASICLLDFLKLSQ